MEYGWSNALPQTEPAADVPTGFALQNVSLHTYLTLHWTKRAMMLFPGDHTKARQTHWLIQPASNHIVNVPHSRKEPLENRVWFAYPGQTLGGKVRNLAYRTIRYPGHRDIMKTLLQDLRLSERRDLLKEVLENAVPTMSFASRALCCAKIACSASAPGC